MYKIEKGIEKLPRTEYPVREMEVGDSFFVPSRDKIRSLRSMATRWGVLLGIKLSVRGVVEDGVEGVRVWRDK